METKQVRLKEVLAIVNNKGGVGKTTTVQSLAVAMKREHKDWRILVIDLDPQGDLSKLYKWQNVPQSNPTITDAMSGEGKGLPVYRNANNGIYFVPSSPKLQKIEPKLQEQMQDRQELCGDFCRGCGYCQPCPAGIEIESCNRMYLFLRRAPYSVYLTDEFYEKMQQVKQCLRCGQCRDKCPYNLDTPNLLQRNYDDFMQHWARKSELNPENEKK